MMYTVSEISPRSNVPAARRSADDPWRARANHQDDVRSPLAASGTQDPSRLADAAFHAEPPEAGILSVRQDAWASAMARTRLDEHAAGPAKRTGLTERALGMHETFNPGEIPGGH